MSIIIAMLNANGLKSHHASCLFCDLLLFGVDVAVVCNVDAYVLSKDSHLFRMLNRLLDD